MPTDEARSGAETLLIVEDEPRLLADLRCGLVAEGYTVLAACDAAVARRLFSAESVTAVVVDRMLPDGDGLTLLSEFRSAQPNLPALVISARDTVSDRVAGLDAGADDYLIKPFAFAELLARLRALLRRSHATARSVRIGGVELDLMQRRLAYAGDAIDLTPRQFELLAYLADHAERPVSREELLRNVWGEPIETATSVVEVSINHLRRKFTRRGWPALIETVRGQGYRLRGEPCED